MAAIHDVERSERLFTGGEAEILWAMLDFHRSTFLWKCEGLDEDQLRRRSVTPSELSLLDLLSHLTGAERHWFQECLLGSVLEPLNLVAPDGEVNPLDPTPVEEVLQRFLDTCDTSRRIASEHSLDDVVYSETFEVDVNFRFIAVHMIEEYARHCGHADLLREAIDGAVGE
jgi:hypothetical protein